LSHICHMGEVYLKNSAIKKTGGHWLESSTARQRPHGIEDSRIDFPFSLKNSMKARKLHFGLVHFLVRLRDPV